MEEKTGRWEKWREKLQHAYRLVIMRDETFEEVGSYKLNLLNLYLVLSTIVVVVAALVFVLIAFTPLKSYLPGQVNGTSKREVIQLNREIDSLTQTMSDWQLVMQAEKNRLMQRLDELPADTEPATIPDSILQMDELELAEVDEQLREEVQIDQIGAAMRSAPSRNPFQNKKRLEQLFFVAPVTGEISAGYSPSKNHNGVDVLAPKNTPVKSSLDGYVFLSDWTLETGNTIGIQHGNNIITFYKHNSALLKPVGSFVKAGEAIAIIGNTGTQSDGPHLHFELWYNGKAVNPVDYISF
ncbi:MAG TPA: M23 family metallopeptidase [Saprospiraceae bacterium]|nr:M23 family metallopeptidase [Saprospiraceae bacterium]